MTRFDRLVWPTLRRPSVVPHLMFWLVLCVPCALVDVTRMVLGLPHWLALLTGTLGGWWGWNVSSSSRRLREADRGDLDAGVVN